MSIKLDIQSYCEECGEFEANVNRIDVTTAGEAFRGKKAFFTIISCEHKNRCAQIYDMIGEKKNEN